MGEYKTPRLRNAVDIGINLLLVPGIYMMASGGGLRNQIVGGVLVGGAAIYDFFRVYEARYKEAPRTW